MQPVIDRPAAPPPAGRVPFLKSLRRTFVAGIAVLLPLVITAWVISIVWEVLDSPLPNLLVKISGWVGSDSEAGKLLLSISKWPGLGLLATLCLVMAVGFLARNLLGKHFLRWIDDFAGKVPVVRAIYSSVKQISDTVFTSAGKQAFRQAVLVHFPTEHSYAIGFVTGEARGAAQAATPEKVMNIFVPTTPNPTSGFLLLVPQERIIPLNLTVEDAFKMIVSGGVVVPADKPPEPPPGEPSKG